MICLLSCFQEELSRALSTLTNPNVPDATEATAPTLQALAAAMVLLRRCRVNAALTIQLFSHLFHYINSICFNKLVTQPGCISARWGAALSARLGQLAAWAERQGLELAADCHLARTHQAARLIQGEYRTPEEVRAALAACFKLNSVQVRALLAPLVTPDVLEAGVQHARALADELCRADGREIVVEESSWLGTALLVPGDGFSAEVVRGVPPGLAEFVAPLQRAGLCRLAHQPSAIGVWTVYMTGYGSANRRPPDPRLQIIQLNKNSNGMGLSIVAAKGAGQSKLGIYIKSLLSVDGHSLVGITQEKAAEYLVRTGPTVTLEVAKQGAVLHGLATLLHQPAYNQRQGENTD
ncbi:DIL domain-containing protein [Phthorimaea operculella]|nr:DIL domain-containing protein [Phthorimaea operculella]